MKLNKILMALAATAIVGCTSDDLNDFGAKQAPEDSRLVELNENFVIAGVGEGGATTRTHWEWNDPIAQDYLINKFLPIYKAGATFGSTLDKDAELEAQAVGLCWRGQTPDDKVYTNYQFYHFGWLNNNETEADLDKCGNLYNGALYSEIDMTGTNSVAGVAGQEAKTTNWDAASPNGVPDKARVGGVAGGADNLNYNSGVYKTDNKSIFKGDYIVYYPFNKDFEKAGTIPAIAETSWVDVTDWKSPEIGHATFRYSGVVNIEGGAQAANFGLYNLSSIVQLRVATVAGDGSINDKIDQIVLYSASKQLLKQANLAADKIADGKEGVELYAKTEGTKTIVASLPTPAKQIALAVKPASSAYITVLPTTVEDLVAFVHNATDKTWAQVELGKKEFKAGNAQVLDIVVKEADFTTDYIAVDEASLMASLTAARAIPASITAPQTITVIGDITLSAGNSPYNINTAVTDHYITIKGDAIVVPEGVTLNLNTNMESKVRVLGTSCCSGAPTGGRLVVQGGTINDVTMETTKARVTPANYDAINPMVTYDDFDAGTTITAAGTVNVQAGNVVVNSAVAHKGNITIAADAKLTVEDVITKYAYTNRADIQFMGSNVTNDGTIEVLKNGKFDMTDANGNAHASDGWRMTNNGTFIHNVDAGVGTAVQSMNQNGEYRCRVNEQIKLDDAFQQWTACSVIEMVNTGAYSYNLQTGEATIAYKHNGKYIDFEVNSGALTTFNDPNTPNSDGKTIQIGNLTVKAGGLKINYAKKGSGNPRTLIVNGDMDVAEDATIQESKKIEIKKVNGTGGNLTVEKAATLTYKGSKKNVNGLAVEGDITVIGSTFDASDDDAIKITCANFYLEKDGATGSIATFGNRSGGADMTMDVTGTISNPEDCSFQIKPVTGSNVLARIECTELLVGGAFSAARPKVK